MEASDDAGDKAREKVPGPPRGRRGRVVSVVLVAALLGLIGFSWLDSRNRIVATQEELARRLRDFESESRDARAISRQAQETTRELVGKLGVLEARVAESQSQQVALEALYQDLSRRRDEWQLAEIEQVLAIASQQLHLSGNVRAALLALQLAEARLARADRPQFLPVRRALARDIERLKALPALDLPGLSLKLDGVVAAVDALPLAHEDRAAKPAAAKDAADRPAESFAARFGAELWSELRQLVTIRRVETPEPPLLLPAHAYFLRENLKLRLMSARVSLLTRDEAGYREDLRVAQQWLRKYFDVRAKPVQGAIGQLKQLSTAAISLELPSISDSLDAVRNYKAPRERRPG